MLSMNDRLTRPMTFTILAHFSPALFSILVKFGQNFISISDNLEMDFFIKKGYGEL